MLEFRIPSSEGAFERCEVVPLHVDDYCAYGGASGISDWAMSEVMAGDESSACWLCDATNWSLSDKMVSLRVVSR